MRDLFFAFSTFNFYSRSFIYLLFLFYPVSSQHTWCFTFSSPTTSMVLGYWLVRLVGFLMFLPEHSIGFSQLPVDANSLGRLHRIRHLISPPGSHLKEFHQSNLIRMNTSSKSSVSSPEERSSPQDSSLDKLYKVSKWAFGLVSLLLFVIPDSTSTKKLASKWGGAGGFGIAAFVLHILSKDTMPGSVDFVKRCHLGLLGFSFLGILSVPGEAGFWPHGPIVPALLTSSLMTVTRLLGIWVALKGWAFHIKDSSFRWTEELWNGTKDNFKGLRIQDKKKGLFYRNSLLVVWLATISNVFQAKFQLQVSTIILTMAFTKN